MMLLLYKNISMLLLVDKKGMLLLFITIDNFSDIIGLKINMLLLLVEKKYVVITC